MRVLLVDDERMEREGLKYLFAAHGYRYHFEEARNGKEALELLQRADFDLVLTDIKMPEMDGIDFLLQAKALRPEVAYIIYSGFSDFAYAKEAISLGVVDYLVKPVNEAEFQAVIARVEQTFAERSAERVRRAKVCALGGQQPAEEDLGAVSPGRALAFYLGKPILQDGAEAFINLTRDWLPGAEVFIENEQEGHVLLSEESLQLSEESLSERLRQVLQQLEQETGTYAHFLLLEPHTDARSLAHSVAEGRAFMNSRFFAARSLIIEDLKGCSDLLYQIFSEIEHDLNQGAIQEVDALRLMLAALREKLTYSNLYTKYSLLKHMERAGGRLSPEQIENFMQTDSYEELEGLVLQVLPELGQEEGAAGPEGAETLSEGQQAVRQAKAFMRRHYGEPLGLEQIAASVYLNPNYFCQLFKRETGRTVITYLTELRMERALELLKDRSLKAGDIARALGYRNPSYFNLIFKNRYGLTPGAYREGLNSGAAS